MSVLPSINECRQNLATYIESLPKSSLKFVYLSKQLDVQIKSMLGEAIIDGNEYFIAPGTTKGWCYIHCRSSIQYLLEQHPNDTISIVGYGANESVASYPFGGGFVQANIGDHFTFGLTRHRGPQNIVIIFHKTLYTEYEDPPFTFVRSQIDCNIKLFAPIIDEDSSSTIENKFQLDKKALSLI